MKNVAVVALALLVLAALFGSRVLDSFSARLGTPRIGSPQYAMMVDKGRAGYEKALAEKEAKEGAWRTFEVIDEFDDSVSRHATLRGENDAEIAITCRRGLVSAGFRHKSLTRESLVIVRYRADDRPAVQSDAWSVGYEAVSPTNLSSFVDDLIQSSTILINVTTQYTSVRSRFNTIGTERAFRYVSDACAAADSPPV